MIQAFLHTQEATGYSGVLFMLLMILAFGCGAVFIGYFFRPHRPSGVKAEAYECGMVAKGQAQERFRITYFRIALLFLLFDVEGIFLFLWAYAFHDSEIAPVVIFSELIIFLLVLLVGYFFAWGEGVFEWA